MSKHYDKAKQKRQAEAQRMSELRQRVRMKGVVVVPNPPKEELEKIVKQANNNASKTAKGALKDLHLYYEININ